MGTPLRCKRASWHGRQAYVLRNGVVQLTTLTGGGHIADFHLDQGRSEDRINPLWFPPWRTIEPYRYKQKKHPAYGSITEAKLLSGIAGHSICLDFFGPPSEEESRHGISEHGEAPSRRWRMSGIARGSTRVGLRLSVTLPVAQLRLIRTIELRAKEPIAYFTESVRNDRPVDHLFHWVQHVTLGPSFLAPGSSTVAIPGTKSLTYPYGYDEGKALLISNKRFRWPNAPLKSGSTIDLTSPFEKKGLGFVVSVLLDKTRPLTFVAAVNRKLGLLIAYCFKRADFPWVAVWEENRALGALPWNGQTQARGLEFGTTPFPLTRREAFAMGKLFGEPTCTFVPARGKKIVRYFAFLSKLPETFGDVRDIEVMKSGIQVQGSGSNQCVVVETPHAAKFLK